VFEIAFYAAILINMNATLPIPGLKPHRITVDELLLFQRSGAFDRLPKMELLDGTLYEMSPQTSAHVRAKNRIMFRLQSCLQAQAIAMEAFSEPTIILNDANAPEPDVIICDAPDIDGYFPAASVRLAIEISITSLQTDLDYKQALYSGAGIPEYWVVDVDGAKIHQLWQPDGARYAKSSIVALGENIRSTSLENISIDTTGLV
jgi:Uma2 family endonuclease